MPIPWYVTLVRLTVPLLIFKWPLWGVLASALVDLKDWNFINFANPSDYIFYQNWDKALDIYYLTIAVITTYKWKDKIAQKLAVGLFFYRLTGDVLFWTTQNRTFLFLFPNFFESFFVFYLLYGFIFKKVKLFTSPKIFAVIFIFLGIPKIIHEYFLHVIQKQPWQFYSLGNADLNFYAQALAIYILPFILSLYFTRKVQKKS